MANKRQAILTAGIDFSKDLGLELGPLNRPVIQRAMGKVLYVDYTDTDSLRERYASDPHVDISEIVEVDATWGGNTLQQALGAGTRVDYIVASHVIEHVPDLIAWLAELVEVLNVGGKIHLAIPDRRYSFDYLRGETRLADIICAHMVHARVPQAHEVLDFTLNKTQIDTQAAWEGAIEELSLGRDFTFDGCMHLANDVLMNATYHDVHCWVFTPVSFARLMREMATHGLTDLGCESFTETCHGEFEFFVRAAPVSDRGEQIESWSRMEREAAAAAVPAPVIVEKLVVDEAGLLERDMKIAARDDELAERARDLASQGEALAVMSATLVEMQHALEALTAVVASYQGSTSWKVTAPLRAIARSIKG